MVLVAELRGLQRSTVGKGPRKEEEGYIIAPVLVEIEMSARTQWDCEVRGFLPYSQHTRLYSSDNCPPKRSLAGM